MTLNCNALSLDNGCGCGARTTERTTPLCSAINPQLFGLNYCAVEREEEEEEKEEETS